MNAIRPIYTTAINDKPIIKGAYSLQASGNIGKEKRINPYAPNFSNIAANIIDPPDGASVCASGNQVCTGNIGILIAKPRNNAKNSNVFSAKFSFTEYKA